jgi:uncharacterized membrane protein
MRGQGKLFAGVVVGAGAMYFLDPDRGARRRSLLRDRGVHAGHKLGHGFAATARDTKNRALGAAAELRGRFRQDQADDEVLHERVRSAIGRVVSHPSAISVTVSQGGVTLSGHVLADEVDALTQRVGRVRGVEEVRNELQIHSHADGIPALQGSGSAPEGRENWAPATRLLVGSAGGLMALKGSRIRGATGKALRVVGLGLIARAASNIPPRRLVGLGAGERAIEVEKTISVSVPLEQVWELWSNFENFPRFMAHVREVRKIDEGHSHWVAIGPAGVPVEWDAVVTDWVPEQFIGWASVEGSAVATKGNVRFRPVAAGQTEIDVQLSYNPPAGLVGHAVASLAGADPKQAMDEDLGRLKSLLEAGKPRSDEESVNLVEMEGKNKPTRARKGSSARRPKS